MTFIIENFREISGIVFPLVTITAVIIRFLLFNEIGKITSNLRKADANIMQNIVAIFRSQAKYKNALFSNKLAILEIYYGEQKFLGFSYDNLAYFTHNIPNLLVSLGLLGTFVGITFNLSDITSVINNQSGEVSDVVQNLQAPLESMAIAFYSSLYAIACAAVLIIANNIWNVDLKKEKLLNLLESRLDNQITPEDDLDSRLKNVLSTVLYGSKKQSENLNEILYQVLQDILYSNSKEDNELGLESVLDKVFAKYFPNFLESIDGFVSSINTFNDRVDVVSDSADKFFESARIFESASEQIDRYSQALYDWRNDFADTQTQFLKTTQHFSEKVEELIKQNEEASRLAKNVYKTFGRSTKEFENSTYRYQEVSEKIERSQFPAQLADASQNLEQFSNAAKILKTNIQGMENMAQTMQTAIETLQQLAQDVQRLNQHSNEIISLNHDRLIQEDNQLTKVESKINSSAQILELIAEEIEVYSYNIQQANTNLAAVSHTLSQLDDHTNEQLQGVSTLTNEVMTLQQKASSLIESHQIQQTEEVKQLSALSQNHKVLIRKVIEYQDNLNFEELTLNLVTGIDQKMTNNINSLAKIILDLSNQNQQTLQETLTILAEIKAQQQQTTNGIDNNIQDNYLQLQTINQTLTELLVIAKQSQQQNRNLM